MQSLLRLVKRAAALTVLAVATAIGSATLASADVYMFTYSPAPDIYATVSGSFSMPVSAFAGFMPGAADVAQPNSAITALSFSASASPPFSAASWSLSDVLTDWYDQVHFTIDLSGVPHVFYGAGDLATNSGGNILYIGCCNVGFSVPSGTSAQVGGLWTTSLVASAVPETSTWAMLILGFAGVGLLAVRKRRKICMLAAA